MQRDNASLHWLADIARKAGLPHSDSLDVDAGSLLADAWRRVAEHCHLAESALAQEVADSLRLPLARLDQRDAHVNKFVPEKIARRFQVVPLRESDRQIVVATADPLNEEVERGVAFASGRMALFELSTPEQITAALDQVFSAASAAPKVAAARAPVPSASGHAEPASAKPAPSAAPSNALEEAVQLVQTSAVETHDDDSAVAPVVRLTNLILRNAVQERASDIHFEPSPNGGTVRFRVDGLMRVHMRMPLLALTRVVSRIKVTGGLDIADRLRPQDGRAGIEVDHQHIDLRISTVPTRDAEKCVIRLLRGAGDEKLNDLHLSDRDLRTLRALIQHRNGVVIVTGPTGSGKTTTLYAAIRELDNGETNISTVEDPIEYELPGITQMQVETKRDFTFAAALRAILRQDPDVILVGEIRDLETAAIAVQASMTGHLVLTTLHTNDAASAITRLVDIGVERPALSATVRGVVAQRLIRHICPHCAQTIEGDLLEEEQRLARAYGVSPRVRTVGCAKCGNTGYLGRIAVFEILQMTPAIQEQVAKGASVQEIQRTATQAGMKNLRSSALQRVLDGETTLQEVERVIGEIADEEQAPVAAESKAFTGPRVLLVEDDAVCRKVAKHLLQQGGYDVVEAKSGEEAMTMLEVDEHIALTVLDLGLPTIQGDEVLRRMRQSPATASMPVIVLTGSPDPDLEVRLIDEGADDYIRKPIEPKRFVTRIKAALRRAAA